MAVNGTNGVHHLSHPLRAGIYAPIPTFFLPESEDLGASYLGLTTLYTFAKASRCRTTSPDIPTFEKHVLKLAEAGVGPLLAGSMGEAMHLSHDERLVLIQATRKVLDGAGFTEVPIIAGTGAGSTRETIQLCHEAAGAGADYAIVITSGYFAGALASNKKALKGFFTEVSEKSPIPVMLYNCASSRIYFRLDGCSRLTFTPCASSFPRFFSPDPGASGGIDLDSDLITEIATDCPNTCGVKLTYVMLLNRCTRVLHRGLHLYSSIDVATSESSHAYAPRSRNPLSRRLTRARTRPRLSWFWAASSTSWSLRRSRTLTGPSQGWQTSPLYVFRRHMLPSSRFLTPFGFVSARYRQTL